MPEGDTIFKIARTLRAVLEGKRLVRVRSPLIAIEGASLAGLTVTSVESRGKNLLIHLEDGRALWTHLRMSGSWHVYRAGERWRRGDRQLRLALEVEGWAAACFNAQVVELLTPLQLRGERMLQLGPDGSAPDFDADEARRRLRALAELPIGEAIVHQRALAGLGNVLKSELLFSARQDPFAQVRALSDERLAELVALARRSLLENRHSRGRVTRRSLDGPDSRWVYRREGEPCRRCGAPIAMARQGALLRSTYYCPRCQAPAPIRQT